jgi:ParB family chromosome partitioning protein
MTDNSTASSTARKPRPGLGRGLSALMGDIAREEPVSEGGATMGVRTLPVGALSPHPGQPRRHFDEAALDELAQSIKARGVIQPIVVRPHGHDFQIVAGERRWRAAQRARLHEVPVIVRDFTEAETLEIALIENIQRQDLNAIEEAEAYQRLIAEYGHTQEALGALVQKSRSHVANLLRLLDLPDPVQRHVVDGVLTMGHARALIGASDPVALARRVIDGDLSVRDTERLARAAKSGKTRGGRGEGAAPDADILALEAQLGDLLGIRVKVSHGPKGGTIALQYSTLDQLDMICQRLSGDAI